MNEEWKMRDKRFPVAYAVLYPKICEVGLKHGYAIALHGSLTHDMDVIAVPWIDKVSTPRQLVDELKQRFELTEAGDVGQKPHGRQAFTLIMDHHCYIDLGVMPAKGAE
jgi:hypothetical protein